MQLDEILDLWKDDVKLDHSKLSNESINIPKLHHKYVSILSKERLACKKIETDMSQLLLFKHEYFMGILSEKELKEKGWEPFLKKVLRGDIAMYIDGDQQIIALKLKIALYKEKIDLLDSIVRTLNTRGFLIKNYIDFEKFMNGY